VPPVGNANFAWVQHILHHLARAGVGGFVLANGSMSSNQPGEGEIRKKLIEADLVDCMIALPGQLFYSTQIPACLWFLARDRKDGKFRDRRGQVLFIDARKLGREGPHLRWLSRRISTKCRHLSNIFVVFISAQIFARCSNRQRS
jgi:type I restriction enzyme M protein